MPIPEIKDYPKFVYFKTERYKVRFVKNLKCYGETDWSKKEIRIKKGLSKRETFLTAIHEILHLFEFEFPIKLKHKQIYKLEKAIFELLFDNFI